VKSFQTEVGTESGTNIALHESGRSDTMTSLRICLAEDNEDLRHLLKALIRSLGHEVVCDAADGEALVQGATKGDVDLVIADLDMPVLDGLAAAERIAQQRGMPIILLSGHADAEQVVVEHEPITLRLLKPVSRKSLEEAIRRAMELGRAGR
jgi:response regulator NasT